MISNTKKKYKKRIIFIDLNSNNDQHLTGNSSLIYKFIKIGGDFRIFIYMQKKCLFVFQRLVQKSWIKNIKIVPLI